MWRRCYGYGYEPPTVDEDVLDPTTTAAPKKYFAYRNPNFWLVILSSARLPERLKGADLSSAALALHEFESRTWHFFFPVLYRRQYTISRIWRRCATPIPIATCVLCFLPSLSPCTSYRPCAKKTGARSGYRDPGSFIACPRSRWRSWRCPISGTGLALARREKERVRRTPEAGVIRVNRVEIVLVFPRRQRYAWSRDQVQRQQ